MFRCLHALVHLRNVELLRKLQKYDGFREALLLTDKKGTLLLLWCPSCDNKCLNATFILCMVMRQDEHLWRLQSRNMNRR